MTKVLAYTESSPLVLHTRPAIEMSDEQFYEFCQINRDWRIERTAEGDLLIMAPAGGKSGNRNALVTAFLTMWALRDGTGVPFDSSTGFNLPNGATRSPDATWMKRSRLAHARAERAISSMTSQQSGRQVSKAALLTRVFKR